MILSKRVGIVGAGSSGLVAAKTFREAGFQPTVFERAPDLGGNWNYTLPVSRVYRSTHTISSKPGTEYPDYPMPEAFPDYPHHAQILEYLRGYAGHFDLEPLIQFDTEVTRITPARSGAPATGWSIGLADGSIHDVEAVVIANGHNWSPRFPSIPGHFTGRSLHSAEYRTPDLFVGQRVLVIGGGNSGCDIVVEAAQNGVHAFHSTRRGYWYMPKYLLGRPSDQVGDLMLRLRLPLWLRRAIATISHRLLIGPPERSGLPRPDHKLFETHPIVNSLLPYYVGHGDITPKPDVIRFSGREVRFQDGSTETVDVVVFATGYDAVFPFLDEADLPTATPGPGGDGGPPALRLHFNVFHPRYDTLFFAGLIQPDSGQFGLVHWQMRAAAAFAAAPAGPAADRLRRAKQSPDQDLGGGVRYKDSKRHLYEVEHWSYERGLRRLARQLAGA